jgi:Tfp pilus assembly protein PilF
LLHQELGRSADARDHFHTALTMARKAGHVRLEYIVLCNLGILLTSIGEFADATRQLESAVSAAVAASDPRSEGQFRGYLALAQAKQGALDAARSSLDAGETLLVRAGDRLSLALLLCDRAEVEHLAKRTQEAKKSVDRASRIAADLACEPESKLCQRLARLAETIEA